jgi:hypothetical protein
MTTTDRIRGIRTAVTGAPLLLLRIEGAVALAASAWAYHQLGGNWAWFAGLLLLPDLAMFFYLAGPRIGAAAYNAAHTYLAPALLALAGLATNQPLWLLGALIWAAHIGMDRMLGYGLKYGSGFGDTHLGSKGKPS